MIKGARAENVFVTLCKLDLPECSYGVSRVVKKRAEFCFKTRTQIGASRRPSKLSTLSIPAVDVTLSAHAAEKNAGICHPPRTSVIAGSFPTARESVRMLSVKGLQPPIAPFDQSSS